MSRVTLTLNVQSFNRMEEQFHRMTQRTIEAGEIAMVDIAKDIMAESQVQVPKGSGTLANSGYITSSGTGEDMTVRVGYGGPNDQINPTTGQRASEYMVPVHEKMNAMHPTGKAKYLEDPVNHIASKIERRLARDLARAMERGV